jgi:NAD(P)H dehydrogenase (quinone)
VLSGSRWGRAATASIAGEDQAYVIAAVLENPQPHDGKIYPLVGPVELNQDGIAEAIGRTLGIPVRYEPIEIAEFSAGLTAKGFPAFLVQHLSNVVQDYRDGIFAGTNNYVQTIGGKRPMTVQEYVGQHREAFTHDGPYSIPVGTAVS